MPKTATSRSNTENSEEQKPTIASGDDAIGGSGDITDDHIHPKVCVCLSVLLCSAIDWEKQCG